MTSYCSIGRKCYSGLCTGSGKCIKDFKTNDLGWYVYDNKVVLATATTYLLNYNYTKRNNIKYYKYGDIITFIYKNKTYKGIVLDSCGACMKNKIIDVFVDSYSNVITSKIEIK